jgi:hypothetical protein
MGSLCVLHELSLRVERHLACLAFKLFDLHRRSGLLSWQRVHLPRVLHQFPLAFEGHSTGLALEAACSLLLLRRPHMHFPVLHQLALGAELGSARVTRILLSETEHQLLIRERGGCQLFGYLFGAANRLLERFLTLGPLWLWFSSSGADRSIPRTVSPIATMGI